MWMVHVRGAIPLYDDPDDGPESLSSKVRESEILPDMSDDQLQTEVLPRSI
jgi:hypothetical protein